MNHRYVPEIDQARLHEVCKRLDVRVLVLFGSHATGVPAPNEESDVDLALSVREPAQRRTWWEYQEALLQVFPERPLDLVWLAEADPLFRWEIMSAGVLLYGDIDDFLEQRAFAYRDFVDSADLRALERTLSMRKLERIRRELRAAS